MHDRIDAVRARAGRQAGLALLLGLAAIGLAACINIDEGCTYPYEMGASADIPFVLDSEHPVATSTIEVSLSKFALPGDVEDRGARLELTLADALDVTLTLVPDGSAAPLPLLAGRGIASVPLDECRPDEPCTVRMLAVVEWLRPDARFAKPATLTVEGLARVPHTREHCGLPADVVTVTTTPPAPRPPAARDATGEDSHDATELVQHVTVRFEDGLAGGDDGSAAGADDLVVTRGHLGITPDPAPPELGPMGTAVTGMWLRVTPDDGGPPILDGPISTNWPPLPADATFPIDATCARPCQRGYWIQAKVYDPAGRTNPDPATAVFGWVFDASVSSAEPPDGPDGAVTVAIDAPDGRQPPPSLVLQGTGAPFRLDGGHTSATLVIDATAPARPVPPLGDTIADVPVVFQLTTVAVDPRQFGQLWLGNGHYLGDGSSGDDEADTGATGGPATRSSPAGRPFAACEGVIDACVARTGLVLRHYTSPFDNGVPTPPYDVHWEWTVVGAPPGSTVAVEPIEGETLGGLAITPPPWPVVVGVLVAGAVALVIAIRGVRTRRRGPGPQPTDRA